MDPLQRMNAKKHPLAIPNKNEQKVLKQVKIQEPVKPSKEEKLIQKPVVQTARTVEVKKEQKIERIEQIKNRRSQVLIARKVEAVTFERKQQMKIQQNNPKPQIKQEKPKELVTKNQYKAPSQVGPLKPQTKPTGKRDLKDIFSKPTKPNPLLQSSKPKQALLASKPQILQKKQIRISEQLFTDAKVTTVESSLKKVAKIQKHLQIGQKKIEQKQSNNHSVRIQIKESIQKGNGLMKSTFYRITGEDEHGSFAVDRKYGQFEALDEILHERWPGCFLPGLSKQSEMKKDADRDRHIRATLSSYLLGLSYSSHIFYREEVQLFLRSPDVNAQEMFKQMPPLKTKDVIGRFRDSFGELVNQSLIPTFGARIAAFVASLRKVIGNLGSLSMKALALSQAYQAYSQSLGRFGKVQKSYEQLCLHEYLEIGGQRAVVIKDTQNKLQKLQELTKHNPFLKLHSFLSNQVRDAQAFLQVIIASQLFSLRKQDLQSQIKELQSEIQGIMLGHKTLKVMTSRRPKEQVQSELEQRQKKLIDQKDAMMEMFSILQIILANQSIDQFISFKKDNYRSILEEWVLLTQTAIPELEAVWGFIAEDSRSHLKP